jgi:hypothetical protein
MFMIGTCPWCGAPIFPARIPFSVLPPALISSCHGQWMPPAGCLCQQTIDPRRRETPGYPSRLPWNLPIQSSPWSDSSLSMQPGIPLDPVVSIAIQVDFTAEAGQGQ